MVFNYDRYSLLKNNNGTITMMPFVKIPEFSSDKYERWKLGKDRLDKLALKYYGNSTYDFFILYANSEFRSEFDIPDDHIIRIPFPLDKVKVFYENFLEEYNQ